MRWTRSVAVFGLAAATVASLTTQYSCTPAAQKPASAAMTVEEKLARGKYLVSVMACTDCHTPGSFWGAPDTARFLAGSEMGWAGPWGVVYARNLTPDSSGLATWTEDQIVTAIRTGNRPDGRQLAPIMPWTDLTHLTDDDAHAIAAYLKNLPAVVHRVPDPLPPGKKATGSVLNFPAPSVWDAMSLPQPPAGK